MPSGVAKPHPGAGDPVPGRCGDQAGHRAPVRDRHIGQRPDPAADLAFQMGPARLVGRAAGLAIGPAVPAQQVAPAEIHNSRRSPRTGTPAAARSASRPGEPRLLQDAGTERSRCPRALAATTATAPGELAAAPGPQTDISPGAGLVSRISSNACTINRNTRCMLSNADLPVLGAWLTRARRAFGHQRCPRPGCPCPGGRDHARRWSVSSGLPIRFGSSTAAAALPAGSS
jgi:hypothetical protein